MGLLTPLIKKLINPFELAQILKMQRNRKKVERVYDDAQLKLYGQILKGDFLHYGYFDNPDTKAEDISLNMIIILRLCTFSAISCRQCAALVFTFSGFCANSLSSCANNN